MRFWGKQALGESNSRRYWHSALDNKRQFMELVAEFFAARPYEINAECLLGHDIYRFRLVEKLPRRFARLASRSAKDLQRAFDAAIVELGDQTAQPGNQQKRFPFANDAEELEQSLVGPLVSLPGEVKDFIRRSRPFPQGDGVLHSLSRLSKARTGSLLKVGAYINTRLVHEQRSTGMSAAAFLNAPTWDEERREVLMLGEDPQGQLQGRVNVQFFVAFQDQTELDGFLASAVLAHQLEVADQLIGFLESADRPHLPPQRATKSSGSISKDNAG